LDAGLTQPLSGQAIAAATPLEFNFFASSAPGYPQGNGLLGAAGGTLSSSQATGEGVIFGTACAFQGQGAVNVQSGADFRCSANAIIGTLADGSVAPSLAFIGDSIGRGFDDAGYGNYRGGWLQRLFENYPFHSYCFAGETGADIYNFNSGKCRLGLEDYSNTIVYQMGRNDLEWETLEQMKLEILQQAFTFMILGKHFVGCTILPAPTSTDGFITYAHQTPSSLDELRIAYNDWLRDTSEDGFVSMAQGQVAYLSAGTAQVADPCVPIEFDQTGRQELNGGCVQTGTVLLGPQTVASVSNKNAWTIKNLTLSPNIYRGQGVLWLTGSNAGQIVGIGYHTATQITTWSTPSNVPLPGDKFEIVSFGLNGVHPETDLAARIAYQMDAERYLGDSMPVRR
jgi:hypothetical protein